MPFTFKQFHIDDRKCGMPVSTDGVLLGAWAPLAQAKQILDIGAGSGLLSLMAAQRSMAEIQAVEIDSLAADACERNFATCDWQDRIQLFRGGIEQFSQQITNSETKQQFDHIICNPPYFDNGPVSQTNNRATARHTHGLSFATLSNCLKVLLSPKGQASLILPSLSMEAMSLQLSLQDLTITRRTEVASVKGKPPHRTLFTAEHLDGAKPRACSLQSLCIRDADNRYTDAMVALTKDFYLAL